MSFKDFGHDRKIIESPKSAYSILVFISLTIPFVYKGVTLASFHATGKVPLAMQMLISLASDGAVAGAAIFNR